VAVRGLLQDAHLKVGDSFTGTFHGAALKLRVVGVLYDVLSGPGGHEMVLDWSTISAVAPDLSPSSYLVTLKTGSNVDAYVKRLAAAQPDLLDVRATSAGDTAFLNSIAGVLFAIAAVIALIGVAGIFNTLMLNTRERVRDTATLKALGMSPRGVIAMVASSAGFLALVGALLAVPGGIWLSRALFDVIISSIGVTITPPSAYAVFEPWQVIVIPVGGVIVAVVAAVIPARWAARTNVVQVLHAE
jgi:putative ABC transport system permease protein